MEKKGGYPTSAWASTAFPGFSNFSKKREERPTERITQRICRGIRSGWAIPGTWKAAKKAATWDTFLKTARFSPR